MIIMKILKILKINVIIMKIIKISIHVFIFLQDFYNFRYSLADFLTVKIY